MSRTLQSFEQLFDVIVTKVRRQSELSGGNDKGLSRRLLGRDQAEAQELVDDLLEGRTGTSAFLFEQPGDIIV